MSMEWCDRCRRPVYDLDEHDLELHQFIEDEDMVISREGYEVPETCECEHPMHGPEGCNKRPMDHTPVVTSPALCGPCLHGCAE